MFELQPAFAVSLIFLPNAIEPGIQETLTPQGSILIVPIQMIE